MVEGYGDLLADDRLGTKEEGVHIIGEDGVNDAHAVEVGEFGLGLSGGL